MEGRVAIVVDDLIAVARASGAARACRDRGAARVIAVASHGVFAPTAPDMLATPDVDQVLVADSLPAQPMPAGPFAAKLQRLPVAPLIAEAIARLHAGGSGRLD